MAHRSLVITILMVEVVDVKPSRWYFALNVALFFDIFPEFAGASRTGYAARIAQD